MNWIKLSILLYAIYFIGAMLITLALYLRMVWIDLENEETGVYNPGDEQTTSNKHQTTALIVAFILVSGTISAQNYGYKITVTDSTNHTQMVHTVSCNVVDSIVVSWFTPAITTFNSRQYFTTSTARHFDFTANNTYVYVEKMQVTTTKKGKLKFRKIKDL